jgi:hypothetical protein
VNDASGVLGLVVGFLALPLLLAGGLASTVHASRGNLPPDERRRVTRNVFLVIFVVVLAAELVIVGVCTWELSR